MGAHRWVCKALAALLQLKMHAESSGSSASSLWFFGFRTRLKCSFFDIQIGGNFIRIYQDCVSGFEMEAKEPYYVTVPAIDPDDHRQVIALRLPMLDVHDVLAYVHNEAKLRTPPAHIDFFWRWCKHANCGFARLGGPGCVPVGLYCDETKFGGNFSDEKVLGVFINLILWRPRSIRYSRFCVFSCRSALILGTKTLYPVMERLTFGFQLAFRGIRPDGSPLCPDGTRFLCVELRGDMGWHAMIWQFKNRWQATKVGVCPFCSAQSQGDSLLYTEVGSNASWRPTIFTDLAAWAEAVLPQDDLCGLHVLQMNIF